jgi:hypothetical protein
LVSFMTWDMWVVSIAGTAERRRMDIATHVLFWK